MNLEDTLKQTFESRLDAVVVDAGDPGAARRTGTAMRVRRRVAVGVAAAVVAAVAVAGSVVATGPRADEPAGQVGQWRELPTPPLSPRASSIVVWTGSEALVIGGVTHVCPPNADCASDPAASLRDGAAYDPATDSWRSVATAPAPISSNDEWAVAAGRLVVRTGGPDWYVYDPAGNVWQSVPADLPGQGYWLSGLGSRVYTPTHQGVAYLDVRTLRWTRLPLDPNRPALSDRTVTATTAGVVVTGYDSTQPHDGTNPSLVIADLFDGTSWKRLPPSDQLDNSFSWTGNRMVDPVPFSENGGQVNGWGRDIPMGGTLDPAAGTWGRLPAALTGDADGWSPGGVGGPWFAVAGQVFNDDTGQVETLPKPEGAPDLGMSADWADGRLVVFGGVDTSQGYSGDALSARAWIFTP